MQKLVRTIALLGVVALFTSSAVAGIYDNPAWMKGHFSRVAGFFAGNGGEFTVKEGDSANMGQPWNPRPIIGTWSDTAIVGQFQSFCIEKNETVFIPGDYWLDITTYATMGGVAGQDGNLGPGASSDSLNPRTAYLYQNFRYNTLLAGYGRPGDAGALQDAIWFIENEITALPAGRATVYFNEAETAVNTGVWAGLGQVRTLNLWGDADRTLFKQDMLTLVPVPGAAVLGVVGLSLVGWFRRR